MSGLAYLGIAFIAIWLVLFVYILILNGRQARLERELKQFKEEKQQAAK
jgi:CcmD family protein